MPEPRTFYGGEPLTSAGGEIGAGHYDGPEAHLTAPWKCPACGVQNDGRLELGCVHCSAGKPGRHVGLPPPPAVESPILRSTRTSLEDHAVAIYPAAETWAEFHPHASLAEAFVAGYLLAQGHLRPRSAQPSTDARALAPHAKAQRTIIAALEIFRDQILSQDPEEVASGEWCSAAEVTALIESLQRDES